MGEYQAEYFGQILRRLRDKNGFSREQLAEMCGVSAQFILRLEGQRKDGKVEYPKEPSYPHVIRYTTQAFGFSPNEVAALSGLWSMQDGDDIPPMHPAVNAARVYLQSLDGSDRELFAQLLHGIIDQHKRMRTIIPHPNGDVGEPADDIFPNWLKRKLSGSG